MNVSHKTRSRHFVASLFLFVRKILSLVKQPVFLGLTVVGNFTIIVSASLFYWLEADTNPHVHSFLDTLWWSVSTVTTVGYGDVIPLSPPGRIVGLFTMIIGTALFWSFTALFAEAMLSRELSDLEEKMDEIQKVVEKVKSTDTISHEETKEIIDRLDSQIQALKRSLR